MKTFRAMVTEYRKRSRIEWVDMDPEGKDKPATTPPKTEVETKAQLDGQPVRP